MYILMRKVLVHNQFCYHRQFAEIKLVLVTVLRTVEKLHKCTMLDFDLFLLYSIQFVENLNKLIERHNQIELNRVLSKIEFYSGVQFQELLAGNYNKLKSNFYGK